MFRRFFCFYCILFYDRTVLGGVQQCVDINPNVICTITDECYNVSDCGVDCAGGGVQGLSHSVRPVRVPPMKMW